MVIRVLMIIGMRKEDIVEFYNPFHKGPDEHMDPGEEDCGGTGMDFRFEKGGKKTTFLTYVK